jgi:hypothetical protein
MTEQARANWIITVTVLIVGLLVWLSLTHEREVWIRTVVDDNGEDPNPYPGKVFTINVGDTTYMPIVLKPGVPANLIYAQQPIPNELDDRFRDRPMVLVGPFSAPF